MALDVKEKAKTVTNPKSSEDEKVKSDVKSDESKESAKKKEKAPSYNLETTKEVEFNVNGKQYKGTQFNVDEGSVEERKADLRANYGENIIKE